MCGHGTQYLVPMGNRSSNLGALSKYLAHTDYAVVSSPDFLPRWTSLSDPVAVYQYELLILLTAGATGHCGLRQNCPPSLLGYSSVHAWYSLRHCLDFP